MNSISDECYQNLDKLSFLFIIISFIIGVKFFKKSKHPEQNQTRTHIKERELIEMEQSFFINNE